MQRTLVVLATFVATMPVQPMAAAAAKTLVYCAESGPRTLDPHLGIAMSDSDAANPIYNRLVELERGSTRLVPALAESWDISEDSRTFTFHLRKGVKWQSNEAFSPSRDFTADDVIFTFDRLRNPENPYFKLGGGDFSMFQGMGLDKKLSDVEKLDDYTVRFTLTEPDVSFLALLTTEGLSIISDEYANQLLQAGHAEQLGEMPIGTGAFQFVVYERNAQLRFKAFPDHWAKAAGDADRVAKVDSLVFAITPDASVRLQKLKAGECQVMRFPNPSDIKTARSDPAIVVQEMPSVDYGFVSYNVEKKPFDDRRVRQALSLAVDKQAILDVVYQGEVGTIPGSLIPPGMLGHDPAIGPVAHDPARAKALLAEAGLPDGFETTLWAMPVARAYMPNAKRAAELIQADWAAIGVKAQIVSYDWGEYLQLTKEGKHDAVILGLNYDYPDPGSVIIWGWSCESAKIGFNRSRWCAQEFDDAIYAAARTADDAERERLYRKAEAIFDAETPAMLTAYARTVALTRPEVEGYRITPVGGQPFFGVGLKD